MDLLRRLQTQLTSSGMYFNKYFFVFAAFLIWLSFFDQFSLITQYNLSSSVADLESEKTEYEEKLKEAIEHKNTILNDKAKFAREKYMFHKENEEVILIPTKENSKKK